jgi:hypothetical protein
MTQVWRNFQVLSEQTSDICAFLNAICLSKQLLNCEQHFLFFIFRSRLTVIGLARVCYVYIGLHIHIVTCKGLAWLLVMGSGFDDWIYWHIITITINYLLQLTRNFGCWGLSSFCFSFYEWLQSQSQSYFTTGGLPFVLATSPLRLTTNIFLNLILLS